MQYTNTRNILVQILRIKEIICDNVFGFTGENIAIFKDYLEKTNLNRLIQNIKIE